MWDNNFHQRAALDAWDLFTGPCMEETADFVEAVETRSSSGDLGGGGARR